MSERDIFIAIMRAAARGRGLHLSADEVLDMTLDSAVHEGAMAVLTADEVAVVEREGWRNVSTHLRQRTYKPPA